MSDKRNTLTEQDMGRFRMSAPVLEQILAHGSRKDFLAGGPLKILDRGCGRGRAVALLRQAGHDAYGIDSDRVAMQNGHELFRARGLDPLRLLRHTDDAGAFQGDSFDIVFSEETIEHIAKLDAMARETYRLIRPGGIAIHSFPGSRWLIEPHLRIPLVHWLPDGAGRGVLVLLSLLLGFGPRPPWPETQNTGLWRRKAFYTRYLAERTCYRPREQVMAEFLSAGFDGHWLGASAAKGWRRLLPAFLRDNGFPAGQLLLLLVKPVEAVSTAT